MLSVAILPQLGASVAGMVAAGQSRRMLDYDMAAYAEQFEAVTWLSYSPHDPPAMRLTPDRLRTVEIVAPRRRCSPLVWGLAAPVLREQIRAASVLRVWNLSGVLPALVAHAWWGCPYVLQIGYDHVAVARALGKGWKVPMIRALRRIACRRATVVFVPAWRMAERWGLASDLRIRPKLVELPNGVDTERFRPGVEPEPRAKGAVLYVGRLSPEKNLLRLAEACRLDGGRLVCVGAGPLRGALVEAGAEVYGPIPNEDLPGWYAGAACFALPSLTEGSPKALLEAMACECPCLSGVPSSDLFGRPGLTVPVNPLSVLDIAAAISTLQTEGMPALRCEARRHVEESHDLRALLRREVDLVHAVAARG